MYLKRIQLVGFKSFVDSTTIPIMNHMNAIVGPNGCGKSNIVDAIRWVIGETSAKQLRGQSMSDVIFNGTSGRKPLGKASVELIFDNSDSRITGEYAEFSEISIRREVVRDGQSQYFINGVQARRRDLIDLFLGTGLGPRSYAIIEQGMISELVEAKPEDMRAHFEEVAGISKYRERRKETENRIRHTQDNLDRLNDVREELEKQIRHLKRQSNAAERYQALKQELRLTHAQMKALQWQLLEKRLLEKNAELQKQILCEESHITEQRTIEKHVEKARLSIIELSDQKNQVERQTYEINANVVRLEQQIQHKQEQVKQWKVEYEETETVWSDLTAQSNANTKQIELLTKAVAELTPQSQAVQTELTEANHRFQAAESNMQKIQMDWENFQVQMAQTSNQLEVTKANNHHYELQLQQLEARQAECHAQLQALPLTALSDALSPLSSQVNDLKEVVNAIQTELNELSQRIQHSRETYQTTQDYLSKTQGELHNLEAQYTSLSALQQSTLEDHQAEILPWLQKTGLSEKVRLGKTIRVQSGWEQAIEVILQNDLDAICVEKLNDELLSLLTSINQGRLTVLNSFPVKKPHSSQKTVLDVVESDYSVPSWLSSIYLAENIADAMKIKETLHDYESVITKQGVWLGCNWIRTNQSAQTDDCFLLREKRLQEINTLVIDKREKQNALQAQLLEAKQLLGSLELLRDTAQQQYQQKSALLTDSQVNFSAKQSQLEALTLRRQNIEEELNRITSQLFHYQSLLQETQRLLLQYNQKQFEEIEQKETLLALRSAAHQTLLQVRQDAERCKQRFDQLTIQLSTSKNQLSMLHQATASNQKQLTQLSERKKIVESQLIESENPLQAWSSELQAALTQKLHHESRHQEIESVHQSRQAELMQLEKKYAECLKQISALREMHQQLEMEKQEISIRQITLKEQIVEAHFTLEILIQQIPLEAELSQWEQKAIDIQQKIDRLGPINLAAIDEYKAVSERKDYMDQQCNDLLESLSILQEAIRKIDRETRHLFRETFDAVNEKFQHFFPKIFGAGQASLMLTDDDLLTTGVIVKAQPPGKRNATIQMLSGGEKTLTAIALMFSLFQLNPAPFCMLDEVDAPLDDLNVGRFCHLVKEMSQDIQFLIISHNKVTIESADHLLGVTMQEPGVSRIVSVDIQAAVELTEA